MIVLFSCGKKKKAKRKDYYAGFEQYISGYTSGIVPLGTSIKIRFTKDINVDAKKGDEVKEKLFSFDPNVSGKAYWINSRELEFVPDKNLRRGQTYKVKFKLGKLFKVERNFRQFPFDFTVIKQAFNVSFDGLKTYDEGYESLMYLKGSIVTADYLESDKVEKILKGKSNGDKLKFAWDHSADGKVHTFRVDSVKRKDSKQLMVVSWDGGFLDIDEKGKKDIIIPGKGEFYVVNVSPEVRNNKRFKIILSDPVDRSQDLRGIVKINGYKDLKYSVAANEIIVYTSSIITGKRTVTVDAGLRSTRGIGLGTTSNFDLWFEELKPAVKFIGKGVIVPSSEGLIVPFSTVSLKAVDLRVIKVFENNIHQFFQNNRYDGASEIKMVGRLVLNKKIDLDNTGKAVDIRRWNDFTINLADHMTVDPGAIYRVELRFRKQYAVYDCGERPVNGNNEEYAQDNDREMEQWDAPGWYSHYYYPDGYEWREKENPCHISYYNSSHFVHKNVFASNIGMIAKSGNNKKIKVFVSDLKNTEPLVNVDVIAYNLQKQVVGKGTTDEKGFVDINLDSKAFLLVARDMNQKSYLRVDDGSSLSVSNFDVSGSKIQKGLKGFIYGERGVWRPGDNIYLTFILEDKNKSLPENHPVVAELYNSRGQFVKRIVNSTPTDGFYCYKFKTDSEAPTGNWNVKIKVGGAVFSKKLRVEAIKPNRLKIDLSIKNDVIKYKSTDKNITLKSAWLHGAKAPELKADVKMTLRKIKTKFEGYSQYNFDDPSKSFYSTEKVIFEGKTDKEGNAVVPVDVKGIKNAPGMLNANFVTRVFEKSGDFSISAKSFKVSPYPVYIGMRMPSSEDNWYKTDTNYKTQLVCIDEDGKPLNRNIVAEVYRISWRWWWDSDSDNLASYVNGYYNRKVKRSKVKIVNGKGTFNLNVKEYGRYFIRFKDPLNNHSCGHVAYFSSWGGFDVSSIPGGASILTLSADKKEYSVGEEIKVRIPSSKNGKALVSLENGSGIVDAFLVKTSDKQSFFTFKATEKMSPNIYVNVSLIQPHEETDNDHPMRMYGIIPIKVTNPNTILKPQISINKELRPEKDFEVKVSEKDGKAMTYTVAIVDEGLLDLTSFKTPNPWKTFYKREALGVKTWDLYDYVMGAYGARLESAFAIGGDEEILGGAKKKAERFKPVVMFKGPFKLEKGKMNKHSFKMPNYIGAVRTMVIAGKAGAYGKDAVVSQVKKPLMVMASLPRLLNPGDKVKIPITVFAMDEKIKDVKVSIQTRDNIINVGSISKRVSFKETGEKIVEFTVKIANNIGKGKIKVIAESGEEKSYYETEAEIRLPNPSYSKIKDAIIEKGKEISLTQNSWGIKGTNKASIEISTMPPLNLKSRLDYLIKYPHGCLEQVVSGAFPQLFLNDLVNLTEEQHKEIMDNVLAAINKLLRYQKSSGGFSYWPGGNYVNQWASIYAGHFMIAAEKQGYFIPLSTKRKWLRYQKNMANGWNEYGKYFNSELIQSYRLYTLALAGKPDIGAMNRMREKDDISVTAKWRLAAAYAAAGRTEVAERIISLISSDIKPYKELSVSFGSHTRDMAMVLETLCLMDKQKDSYKMALKIAKELGEDIWMSTQTTAYSLMSMSMYMKKFGSKNSLLNYDCKINDKSINQSGKVSFVSHDVDIEKEGKVTATIKNNSEGPLYARFISTAVPMIVDKAEKCEAIDFDVKYYDGSGNLIKTDSIVQGTDIIATVTVHNKAYSGKLEQMAISAIFPSGWEIINSRLFGGDSNGDEVDYMDIRDDRVYLYFSLGYNETKTFNINLNATFRGDFYMPAISCYAMYDNEIREVVPGKRTKVIKQE
jgi:uncharacterized protein YfaS (alpha-2-macroglobulin family)